MMQAENRPVSIAVYTADAALAGRLLRGLKYWAETECVNAVPEWVREVSAAEKGADLLLYDADSLSDRMGEMDAGLWSGAVIVTGDHDRAINAYRRHPAALLRPDFNAQQLHAALESCFSLWQSGRRWIELPFRHRRVSFPQNRFRYAEAQRNDCLLCFLGQELRVRMPLGKLAEALPAPEFVRCHKSYLVRLAEIERLSYSELRLRDGGPALPVGRVYYDALRQALEARRSAEEF